ncbi:MAG: aldehyde dehydrogenase family protein, partial [Myxococcota bacterium]
MSTLNELKAGQELLYAGNRLAKVSAELADAFQPGDRLLVVDSSGEILHVPARDAAPATAAIDAASQAFFGLAAVSDDAISSFFEAFAARLEDDATFSPIAAANQEDVAHAHARGRSTTRLVLSPAMRAGMVAGLRTWRDAPTLRNSVREVIEHDGWFVEQRIAGLGVVGFVFEGRPNVFADACGVLRSGNTVVFRIGSDALGTARAIVQAALAPALEASGLPPGSVALVDSPARAAGYALFSDPRLALAVARGSGPAVATLGAVARQTGTPVSLHGTGGAWMVIADDADPERVKAVVQHSLDRKVCNTLNTCIVSRNGASALVPSILSGLEAAAAARGNGPKLHVVEGTESFVPKAWFTEKVRVQRAEGTREEAKAEAIDVPGLGREWEWEGSPEITVAVVDDVEAAVELFNRHSPRFIASILSESAATRDAFYAAVDAPFVSDGFTRWVD